MACVATGRLLIHPCLTRHDYPSTSLRYAQSLPRTAIRGRTDTGDILRLCCATFRANGYRGYPSTSLRYAQSLPRTAIRGRTDTGGILRLRCARFRSNGYSGYPSTSLRYARDERIQEASFGFAAMRSRQADRSQCHEPPCGPSTTAMHSTSTRAPRASPLPAKALRAG